MRAIKKGATDQSVVIRIVDETTGVPETGVTSATGGIDLEYRREGGAVVNLTESDLSALTDAHADGGLLHITGGYYRVDLPDAACATGANGVLVAGTVTGMVVIGCYVHLVDYDPQDTVRLGLTALPNAAAEASGGLYTRGSGAGQINQNANGQVDTRTVAMANDTITSAAIATGAIDADAIADNAIDAGAIAADAITAAKIATGAIDADAIADNAIDAGAIAADAITSAKIADNAITANKLANNAITAAKIATDAIDADALAADAIAEINATVDTALADYDGPTHAELVSEINSVQSDIAALNDLSAAEVNAEVDAAIETYHLDHLLAATYDPASKPGAADALLNELVENDGGVARYTANALEEAPTGGSAPTVGEIADAVWDEATAGHTTSGTFGEQLKTDVDAILDDTDDIGVAGAGLTVLATAAELAKVPKSDSNVTWNATAAAQLQSEAADALTAYDPPTRTEATSDKDEILTRLGSPAGASVSADIADVEGKVDDLETRVGTPSNLGSGATVAANLADIESQTDDIGSAGAGLTAIPWNALWDAEVQSEVADALEDTIADSIPADGSRPSVKQALYMLTQFMVERSVSTTTVTVKKPDGTTTLFTLTLNDPTSPTSITRAT